MDTVVNQQAGMTLDEISSLIVAWVKDMNGSKLDVIFNGLGKIGIDRSLILSCVDDLVEKRFIQAATFSTPGRELCVFLFPGNAKIHVSA